MLQLPEDVIFLIVEQLDQLHRQELSQFGPLRYQPGLSQYAVVNRTWNAIIERKTFRHIFVHSEAFKRKDYAYSPTPTRFKQMMNRDPARRRAIIHQISFYATHEFPLDSYEAQSEAGGVANDRHFSQSVREFWKVLQGLEWPKGRTFTLRFTSLSVVKPFYAGRIYHSGPYLHLIGDTLPYLSCVSSFLLAEYLRICPSSLVRIVATMKGLRHVQLRLDDTVINPKQRFQYRKGTHNLLHPICPSYLLVLLPADLGTCISQLPTSSLLSFEAVFSNVSLGFPGQLAVTPGSPDILCIGIRNLSMYLRDLRLEDLRVSPELFWPTVEQQQQQSASGPTSQPLWPHLETLYLTFDPEDSYGVHALLPITPRTHDPRTHKLLLYPPLYLLTSF